LASGGVGLTVEMKRERAIDYSERNFIVYSRLSPAKNIMTISARDRAGNMTTADREVVRIE